MNLNIHRFLGALACSLLLLGGAAHAQVTAFTYQGRLANNGQPASGSYDLSFKLYTVSQGGSQLAGPATNAAVAVSNGLFTTTVDFGNVFAGGSNWLEIAVSTNGANAFSTLAPRQLLTPVPYAILANAASNVLGAVSAAQLTGSIPVASVSGVLPLAQIPTVVVTNGASSISVSGSFSGNGSGLTNLNAASLSSGTLADIRLSTNVALLNTTNFFTGTNTFAGVLKATNANNVLAGSFSGSAAGLTNVAFLNGTNVFAGSNVFAGVLKATNAGNIIVGAFTGNGANLTNLSANSLAAGTVAQGLLPAAVVTNNQSNVTLTGTFSGDGSGLANLNGTSIASGTVADARLSANVALLNGNQTFTGSPNVAGVATITNSLNTIGGTLNGIHIGNGAGLTNLAADNLASGTISQGRLPSAVVTNNQSSVTLSGNFSGTHTGDGSGLTGLNAANVTAGVLSAAQLPGSVITNNASGVTLSGTLSGTGTGLTSLNGANIASGIVADARLSANVALLNGNQTFTGSPNFSGAATITNSLNTISGTLNGTHTGSGAGLTNLAAGNITSGTLGLAQLPSVVVTNNRTGLTLGGTFNGVFTGNGAGLTNVNMALSRVVVGDFGNFNTAEGLQALQTNNTGTLNTANGFSALINNTNGSFNTASGASALSGNTAGSRNTANGYSALVSNTTGSNNTASGVSALAGNITGMGNTAEGYSALQANTVGSTNTALGYLAGSSITGNYNIDIGNSGVAAESGIIRIGDTNYQTTAYIAGINGTALTGGNPVYVDANGKLGASSSASTITSPSTFAGAISATNANNTFYGTYNGNGSALTNLNAANITGTIPLSKLPTSVVTNNGTGYVLGGTFNGVFNGNGAGLTNVSVNLGTVVGDFGNHNTGEGFGALGNVTTNNGGGFGNTADGALALYFNTNGTYNAAYGYTALINNINGTNNIALGARTGLHVVNGNNNIFLGNAGSSDESGVIRIGDTSLHSATYVAGINGVDITTGQQVFVDANGRLGTNSTAVNYDASKLSGGTLSDSRLSANIPRLNAGQTFTGANVFNNAANSFTGNGGGLTSLNAGNVTAGTLPDGQLSANVPLLNASQTFTGINEIHDTTANHGFRITDGTTVGNINLQTADGGNSGFHAINFNGYIAPAESRYNTSKNRWRIVVDHRTTSDYFNIDTYNGSSITAVLSLNTNGNVTVAGTVTANSVLLTSDRNAKENFAPVSTRAVLEKVAALPITEWNYKIASAEVRHVGPMAQDFKASFGLNGQDDQHINVVDESGVALAAIQGLNEKLQDESKAKDAQIQELKARLEKLEQFITGQKGAAQ